MERPPHSSLPSYITLFRIKRHRELNFLTALLWSPTPSTREAILYSPHGLYTSTYVLQTLLTHADPGFSTLALLHGKESWTRGWQTTFGAKTGLQLYRESTARYWISTCDDRLRYGGVVWWLVTDVFRSVGWTLGQDGGGKGEGG